MGCSVKKDWRKIRTFSPIDMELIVNKGIGGGISYIVQEYGTWKAKIKMKKLTI